MELIYLYVKKFGDFIFDKGLQLSNDFAVEIKDRKLTISQRGNHLQNFYGDGIKNLSVLVGKNGSGKTTILDILGMSRQDRLQNSIIKRKVEDEYFLLYYLGKDNDDEDLFGIEIMGENVLNNMFENYDNEWDDERYDKSKASIGKVYRYDNDQLVSIGKHFFDYNLEDEKLSELIRYVYIGERHRYSSRNMRYGGYNEWDGGYIAERKFNTNPTVYKKYLTAVQCISGEIKGFDFGKVKIKFWDDIDCDYFTNGEEFQKYEKLIKEIAEELQVWKKINVFGVSQEEDNKFEKKQKYISDLYSRYILDMLINGLYTTCKDNREEGESEKFIGIEQYVDYIKQLGSHSSSEKEIGKPIDFEVEIIRIKKLIAELKSELDVSQKNTYLKILARYIGSRLHSEYENGEFGYVEALESLVEGLLDVPEECFSKQAVEIIVKGKPVLCIEKLLKEFSYFSTRRERELHSDVGSKFRISFELLSEGEERFLDIVTKINDSIVENKGAELLVLLLDEPDQSLHPEWSRRFVDIISQAISSIFFDGNIQVVLSTHSPFFLSDILPRDVFLLEREGDDRQLNIHKLSEDKENSCFGANIYDLMKNEFFMNNTVGEFATKKINDFMKKISEIGSNGENIEEIEYFVEQIGEPIIQRAMKKQLEKRSRKLQMMNNKEVILEMITNEGDRERVKEYLQMLED